jgi:hypothetical protein
MNPIEIKATTIKNTAIRNNAHEDRPVSFLTDPRISTSWLTRLLGVTASTR